MQRPTNFAPSVANRHPRQCAGIGLLAGLVFAPPLAAQEIEGLLDAVAYYHEHATSDYLHILEATYRFEAVAGAHPEEWLPAYWTGFAYSQLGLFASDERTGSYVTLARQYYDKAWNLHTEGDSVTDADFHALDGLIKSFEVSADPARASAHRRDMRAAWDRARALDPLNPMVAMNGAINLLSNRETRDEAYRLVELAIERYAPRMGSTRPNWGREFLDVWTGRYPRNDGRP